MYVCWTTPMGFTNTFGVQVVDMGGYEPFVWRCDWRAARFASLTDMFLVIYLAGSCANLPLFVAFVGNACSNYLYLSWLEDSILLLEISLPMADVCSRGRWVDANLPRSMSFSLLSIHSSSVLRGCIPCGTYVAKGPPVGYVGPVTTHADGFQLSAKENPFGLVLRSVTNVMVFDTVIPPGCSIGL